MADDKILTAEEAEAEWWKDWWSIDFSWEGLAEKEHSTSSDEEQSIAWQGYWRRDPISGAMRTDAELLALDELVTEAAKDGGTARLWHIAHVPLEWADGSPAKKGWNEEQKARLRAVINARLQTAKESPLDKLHMDDDIEEALDKHLIQEFAGTDGHANFIGVVLFEPLRHPLGDNHTIHLTCAFCYLVKGFENGARLCSGTLLFESILSNIPFENSNDDSIFILINSVILENISTHNQFIKSKEFKFSLYLNGCKFIGYVNLSGSIFLYKIYLFGCTFAKYFLCRSSSFKKDLDFSRAIFSSDSNFYGTSIEGNAIFSGTEFLKNANYTKVKFESDAIFDEAKFIGKANFYEARFNKSADFSDANFTKQANFSAIEVAGSLEMSRTDFMQAADFSNAHIMAGCAFTKATFRDRAAFNEAYFEWQGKSHCVSFRNAKFDSQADFKHAKFPQKIEHISNAFWGARFLDVADFSDTGVHWISAFNETLIEKKLLINKVTDEKSADDEFNQHMLNGCQQAAGADCDDWTEQQSKLRMPSGKKPKRINAWEKRERHNARLGELEGGCRTIKLVMGLTRDETLEQRYYRYQLRARTHRTDIPPWEKFAASAYGLFSDFGASVSRPLIWLVLLVSLSAVGFWSTGLWLGFVKPEDINGYYQALGLSWTMFLSLFQHCPTMRYCLARWPIT